MTWVFGSATNFFGTAISLADIQVTLNGETYDCLRKLYGIEQNVVAGFAGNVETGFTMLSHLQRVVDEVKATSASTVEVEQPVRALPVRRREGICPPGRDGTGGRLRDSHRRGHS